MDEYTNIKKSGLGLLAGLAGLLGTVSAREPIDVLPKTPEAFALHYVDNLDAKMEMLRDAYAQAVKVAPGIYDRVFPLPSNLIRPLREYEAGESV